MATFVPNRSLALATATNVTTTCCWPRYNNFSFKAGNVRPPLYNRFGQSNCGIPYFGNRSFRAGEIQPPNPNACIPRYACRSGRCNGVPNPCGLGNIQSDQATVPPSLLANP